MITYFTYLYLYIHHIIHMHHQVHPMVLAFLWRLVTRHLFFATGHACSFNKLQFSAAFVANFNNGEFEFYSAGLFLFVNTFGWELLGFWVMRTILAIPTASATTVTVSQSQELSYHSATRTPQTQGRHRNDNDLVDASSSGSSSTTSVSLWRYMVLFQSLELCCCCISASLMRRHLMIWAIFAPRFVFSAVLTSVAMCFSLV
jgi:phosphatidylinositol glycan class O